MFYSIYESTAWLDDFLDEFASNACYVVDLKRESFAGSILQSLTTNFHPLLGLLRIFNRTTQ